MSLLKAVALAYHDVVPDGQLDYSGFGGASAGSYKLDASEFRRHIAALAAGYDSSIINGGDQIQRMSDEQLPLLLTFDDGGCGAMETAEILEEHEFRGFFFVVTDLVGQSGFLTEAQIRDLDTRGHVIGTHSSSHPPNIAKLPRQQIEAEWRKSVDYLNELLGKQTAVGSVPRGYTSQAVCEAASSAGIEILFNSEPTKRIQQVGGCYILGRYAIRRDDSSQKATQLASARATLVQAGQALGWSTRKIAKRVAGRSYERIRQWTLGNRYK